jgi:hypothetical protein
MRRVLALVFVVAVLLPTVFVSAAGAEPGKNPPNGLGPAANPSPTLPVGAPAANGCDAHGWAVGHRERCLMG